LGFPEPGAKFVGSETEVIVHAGDGVADAAACGARIKMAAEDTTAPARNRRVPRSLLTFASSP